MFPNKYPAIICKHVEFVLNKYYEHNFLHVINTMFVIHKRNCKTEPKANYSDKKIFILHKYRGTFIQ